MCRRVPWRPTSALWGRLARCQAVLWAFLEGPTPSRAHHSLHGMHYLTVHCHYLVIGARRWAGLTGVQQDEEFCPINPDVPVLRKRCWRSVSLPTGIGSMRPGTVACCHMVAPYRRCPGNRRASKHGRRRGTIDLARACRARNEQVSHQERDQYWHNRMVKHRCHNNDSLGRCPASHCNG